MSKEAMKLALEVLESVQQYMKTSEWYDGAITALREALAEQPAQQEPVCYKHGDEPKQGCAWCDKQPAHQEPVAKIHTWHKNGIQHAELLDWGVAIEALPDGEHEIYTSQPTQKEPAAVVSGYYGGQCVILPIDPAQIFNSNTALYTSPPPCPTCEALVRTVMLDQTSHDAQRKPLTDEVTDRCIEAADTRWADAFVPIQWARHFKNAIEAAHGIKGDA